MKEFLMLLKISLKTNLTSTQSFSTRKKAASGLIIGFVIVGMFGYIFMLAYQMGKSFAEQGLENMLILFGVIGGSIFVLLNSLLSSFNFIFKSKDHDLLLSMPIKTTTVFFTKLSSVLALLYVYLAPIYIPFISVYFIFAGANAAGIIYAAVGFFFTPLFALFLGILAGMLLNALGSLRFAKPLYLIFSLAFIIVIIVISSNPMQAMSYLAGNGGNIIGITGFIYYPFRLLLMAIEGRSFLAFLGFLAINIIPILVLILVASKYYVKLTSFYARGKKARKFEYKELNSTNLLGVMVKKELKRLFSSMNYLLNSCIGPVLLIVFTVINIFTGVTDMLGPQSIIVAMLLMSMMILINSPLAVSISLEGEAFWIYKSIPVKPSEIIIAKIIMQLIVFLPLSLIGTVMVCLQYRPDVLGIIALFLFTFAINFFGAVLGMTVGLKKYNLHYTNEMQIVKQSSAVIITMLIGIVVASGLFIPYIMFLAKYINDVWYAFIATSILAIAGGILYYRLMNITSEEFNKIN